MQGIKNTKKNPDADPDTLRYIYKTKEGEPAQPKEVIFIKEQKRKVFLDVHDSSRGAHMAIITKTIAKISERFYWIGIKKDVV